MAAQLARDGNVVGEIVAGAIQRIVDRDQPGIFKNGIGHE